jgi:hypothetical protein
MKKIYSLILGLFLATGVYSQAPQKMSYQAVIRNNSNALITSTPVGMRISILQGSATGTAIYVETQTPITNANGLVSLAIGNGTVITGSFSAINWANGPYYIKTETDPFGGTAYTIIGTSELMSVPYALFSANITPGPQGPIGSTGATGPQGPQGVSGSNGTNGSNGLNSLVKTNTEPAGTNCPNGGVKLEYGLDANNNGTLDAAEVNSSLTKYVCNGLTGPTGATGATGPQGVAGPIGPQGPNTPGTFVHYIGEQFGGGVIFHLWKDNLGAEHGLIVDILNLGLPSPNSSKWSNVTSIAVGIAAQSQWDGLSNSNAIIAQSGHTTSAALLCLNSTNGGQTDWYLPAIDELRLLLNASVDVNRTLSYISGSQYIYNYGYTTGSASYWSSTECGPGDAFYSNFSPTNVASICFTKNSTGNAVRAIRAF